jgi:lysophospholipid hydrolase
LIENSLTTPDPLAQVKNLHTIAIMPASLDVPLTAFSCELYHVLNTSTRVLRLSSRKIAETLGECVLEKQADFRLMHWLNAQEDAFSLILYECDYTSTNWTRRCLRQADTILVIGLGNEKAPKRQLVSIRKFNPIRAILDRRSYEYESGWYKNDKKARSSLERRDRTSGRNL